MKSNLETNTQTMERITQERDQLRQQLEAMKGWVSPEKIKALVEAGDELKKVVPDFLSGARARIKWDSAKEDL